MFDCTTRLLRLNAEYYTVWNVRRRCLIARLQSPEKTDKKKVEGGEKTQRAIEHDAAVLTAELHFTIPLLLEFPKCYWIWSYRLWVLHQATARLDAAHARGIWVDELALDSKMLTKDRRNFHAWGYRRQVVEELEKLEGVLSNANSAPSSSSSSSSSLLSSPASLTEPEFDYTTKMIRRDLSNFSAWHSRSKLIPRLLDERGADDAARRDFLEAELALVREALNVGPEDQSLWFYHQFLVLNLLEPTGRATIAPALAPAERLTYMARELDAVRDLLADYDDVKWIYEALLEYTLAVARMEERPLAEDERLDVQDWLGRLRALDPKRTGRWDDIELEHIRGRPPVYVLESL